KAATANSDYCFPNRLQDIGILELAINANQQDGKAPYYLGNLWYDKRQYDEAISNWELSSQRDQSFPTVFRNLGIACYNKLKDANRALRMYEQAFDLNSSDGRVLMELDQLYRRLNKAPKERLAFLENHLDVVERRDDLYLERAALYNFIGEFEKAYDLIMQRKFHPWEGGEGKVSAQYCYSLVEMAKENLAKGNLTEAIAFLEQAQVYPEALGEGKLYGTLENDIFYWTGCALEELGDIKKAKDYFKKALEGSVTPSAALVYNDQQPDKIFYKGLAWIKLGEKEKAERIFCSLDEYGTKHLNDEVTIDYFAVSLPDLLIFEADFNKRNRVHCHYMSGLGRLGKGMFDEAIACFKQALAGDAMHFGSNTHLRMAKKMQEATVAEHHRY
ncbi:MAG TPA: tetratricopeptide repeat protein, partial [Chitinophagaceae bacterium]|nr:tetratricopeptide repeat protein [Chitinophagaceae bacterium]